MSHNLRLNVSSGAPWEPVVGYSRAVRIGPHVFVAGTTAIGDHGEVVATGNVYGQTVRALQNIESALKQAGASMADVVRTRIFIVNADDWMEVGRAHGEFFGEIRPVSTMVEVRRLITPEVLVEIEAEAIIEE